MKSAARQRLLTAGIVTLALHGALLFSHLTSQNRPQIAQPTPLPVQHISVTLTPSPPPQKTIHKERLPLPTIQPTERKPLEALPPEQHSIVKQQRKPPTVKTAGLTPMETLPPVQHRIARAVRPAPVATLQPLIPLPIRSEPEAALAKDKDIKKVSNFLQQNVQASQNQQSVSETEDSATSSFSGTQEAAPLYASNPPPNYPMQARRRGLQGVVIIEALIDVSGNVADLRLYASSGHSILDRAALNSVRAWQFTPGTVDGQQKQMWVKVPVRFKLN